MQSPPRSYWCFISYSHADNREPGRQWADWLHQSLETYEVPPDLVGTQNENGECIPERIFPIFRDEDELSAASELAKSIESALRHSRVLVVLCSPRSAKSRYVAEEISKFKQLGRNDRILAAIVDGKPGASETASAEEAALECFPAFLRYKVDADGALTSEQEHPIAADFRLPDGGQGWTNAGAFRQSLESAKLSARERNDRVSKFSGRQRLMFLKIVAGLLSVPVGRLTQRDTVYQLEAQRRRTRLLRRWLTVVAVLAAATVLSAIFATREASRANHALANLKASAPAMLQLGESEAGNQNFDSALDKINAALGLDPGLRRALWQRAWTLLALERWQEAAESLRTAAHEDPEHAALASILPEVEKMAGAAAHDQGWDQQVARTIFEHLKNIGATGPALALGVKLKLRSDERAQLVIQKLQGSLGKDRFKVVVEKDGVLYVNISNLPMASLEPLRRLPVEHLDAYNCGIKDLEPLRGLPLVQLNVGGSTQSNVSSLEPLRGMKLQHLSISKSQVTTLAPLKGMPLRYLDMNGVRFPDLAPLEGMPLEHLVATTGNASSVEPLRGMPLRELTLNSAVADIAPLRQMPLEFLEIRNGTFKDISPLQGLPVKSLVLKGCTKIQDYSSILTLAHLEKLSCDVFPKELLPLRESKTLLAIDADLFRGEGASGYRPVAEFWRAYDAKYGMEK